jgi:hypothetical protein
VIEDDRDVQIRHTENTQINVVIASLLQSGLVVSELKIKLFDTKKIYFQLTDDIVFKFDICDSHEDVKWLDFVTAVKENMTVFDTESSSGYYPTYFFNPKSIMGEVEIIDHYSMIPLDQRKRSFKFDEDFNVFNSVIISNIEKIVKLDIVNKLKYDEKLLTSSPIKTGAETTSIEFDTHLLEFACKFIELYISAKMLTKDDYFVKFEISKLLGSMKSDHQKRLRITTPCKHFTITTIIIKD